MIVVAADAGKRGWSDCFATPARVARQDDVAFVGEIIDRVVAGHDADPQRVYVVGVSRAGNDIETAEVAWEFFKDTRNERNERIQKKSPPGLDVRAGIGRRSEPSHRAGVTGCSPPAPPCPRRPA